MNEMVESEEYNHNLWMLTNHDYTGRITSDIYEINVEPLDLSMKCDRGGANNNTDIKVGESIREISVVPVRNENKSGVREQIVRRRSSSRTIPTNPDSAEHDLAMVTTRLELVMMKYYGHILKFDRNCDVKNDALQVYNKQVSNFCEMILEPVQGKDYTDVLQFYQFTWKIAINATQEFNQITAALIKDFPHFNKFEICDQDNLIKYGTIGLDLTNNLSLFDFDYRIMMYPMKDGDGVCFLGEKLIPSFYPEENGERLHAKPTLKKLLDFKLPMQQQILLRCIQVYSKEFMITENGYLMAKRIQYLLCEALRSLIVKDQKDETLLPKLMTILETDFIDCLRLHASHDTVNKMSELLGDVSDGTLTPEQCRKWTKGRW